MDTGEAHTIDDLMARALAPYDQRPDAVGVAHLIDDLITAGQSVTAQVAEAPTSLRTEVATSALAEWKYFSEAGPLRDGDHAAWNHARGLARILRSLVNAARNDESAAEGVIEWCQWHDGPAQGPVALCWGASDSGPGCAVPTCQQCRDEGEMSIVRVAPRTVDCS